MIKKYLTLPLTAVLMLVGTAHGAGDIARGKAKSVTCAACHGADGNSVAATFPKLAGQNADYLVHTLNGYKKGTRKNAIMSSMAAPLSPSDIEDLAAYYASQTGLIIKK